MQLTEHFALEEFSRSDTARQHGIDNTIPASYIPNLQRLCREVLEPLRAYAGEPVTISSGYRCPELNRRVGGVRNSQHLTGNAADIYHPTPSTLLSWYTWLRATFPHHQVLYEHRGRTVWIHVGYMQPAGTK